LSENHRSPVRPNVLVLNNDGNEDPLGRIHSLLTDPATEQKNIALIGNGALNDLAASVKTVYPEITDLDNGSNLGRAEGYGLVIKLTLD